uniref:Secreted protein n=1 Tax=Denticeps clupeoides TaxID=299321 RepID=A0AAY4BV57_9TELE
MQYLQAKIIKDFKTSVVVVFFFFFGLIVAYLSCFCASPARRVCFYFRCFSSLSPLLEVGPSPACRLAPGLLRNILSSPFRASVR